MIRNMKVWFSCKVVHPLDTRYILLHHQHGVVKQWRRRVGGEDHDGDGDDRDDREANGDVDRQIHNNEKDDTDQLKPQPGTDYANLSLKLLQ